MNPILPVQHFVPDVEARQWQDGRMYLYGSYDISGGTTYCSYEYHVFSSDDLINWKDHGESFRSTGPNSDVPWAESPLYAPDCIFYKGQYYLFFCLSDNSEGIAVSPRPAGRFTNAAPVEISHDAAIDPAVLVDEDQQVYYYWGQFHLRGARLQSDLKAILPDTLCPDLLTEAAHGFHEGASIRKRNGVYYLVYTDISRGRATCLAYATSLSPLGPFEKRGILIDNAGCDPHTWNNHGSIAEFNGQWYVFYHRSSQASNFNRRVCVEPIHFNPDGSIDEVEMTTQGVSAPLTASTHIDAWRACLLSGQVRTEALGSAETGEWGEHLSLIHDGDWAAYKYLDLNSLDAGERLFTARVASLTYGGTIEVRLDDPDGPLLGTCAVPNTGGWHQWAAVECPVERASGIHALYLLFHGRPGRLFNLASFSFM
jgi:arabinoxylan arabinofuranohydrolase